jgi:hypothetical protein
LSWWQDAFSRIRTELCPLCRLYRDFVPAAYYCDNFSVTWPIQTPLAAIGPP